MAKIVIKKRISLDFLGDEHKDDYFTFQTIPLSEYEPMIAEIEKKEGKPKDAIPFMLKVIKDKFIEGKFDGEAVAADDLDEIDADTAIEVFQTLTGQKNPKVTGQSEISSDIPETSQPR